MTVGAAKLMKRGQWKQDQDGSESVVDVYEVVSDTTAETITAVLGASGLPAKGAGHAERSDALCVTRSADQLEEAQQVWHVSCEFSTKLDTREDAEALSQRVKGGMQSASVEVPAYFDARGYPLVNTAGDVYEGLTRKQRLRVIPCTFNFDSIPNWFFELSDTLNASAVTIHGQSYPPGTCLLTDIDMPDEPQRDKAGTLYWPVSYKITINPSGYYVILPNKGKHELIYQTRGTTAAAWADDTKANYDAESDADLKRVIKRRIQTDEQQEVAADIWLDANGQAQRVLSLRTTQLGLGAMTAGDATLTLSSGTFATDGSMVGALVRVMGVGPKGRIFEARIDSVTDATHAELSALPRTTATGKAVWLSGAIVNYFVLEDLADWSTVPLPNNHPGGA